MAGHIRELVYRLVLLDGRKPPGIFFRLVPNARTLRVETLATNIDADGNVWRLVNAEGSAPEIEAAMEALKTYRVDHVMETTVLAQHPRRILLWLKYGPRHAPDRPSLTRIAYDILGRETFITDRTTPTGMEVRVVYRHGAAFTKYLRELEKATAGKFDFKVIYVGPPRFAETTRISNEDEDVLIAARDVGFFDIPRKGGLRDVAQKLQCSLSSASYRLRRAESKLVKAYLGDA